MDQDAPESESKSETVEVFDDRLSELSESSIDEDKKYRNAEWLYQQYHILGKTQEEIGQECDVSKSTIYIWMKKHDIETDQGSRKNGKWSDKSWLFNQYHEHEKTIQQIADENDCHWTTINYWLDKHGIERRSPSEYHPDILDGKKYHDRDWLYHQYVELGKGAYTIADELGVNDTTIYVWLDRHDIETRTAAESVRKTFSIPIHVEEGTDNKTLQENTETVTQEVGMRQYTGSVLGIDSVYTHINDGDSRILHSPYRDKDWLQEQYDKHNTLAAIAEEYGISPRTLGYWADKHDIQIDPAKEIYDREDMIEAIQRCASEIGEPVSKEDYYNWSKEQEDAPADTTIVEHESFDDWNDVVESANVIGPHSEIDCPVGDELRQLRQSMNLTQSELADKVGTTYNTIGRYEHGDTTPTGDMALQLRSILEY